MKKIAATIGILGIKLLGYLPFWSLYFISDILFLISYYIVRYRKKTVQINLKNSFPEKTGKEIEEISFKFYRHFSDLIVETIKAYQISEKELNKRFKYKNPEVLNKLYAEGKSVALLSGHYANWELTIGLPRYTHYQINVIYRSIQNSKFDKYMKDARSRFGMFLMPASISLRTMLDFEKKGKLTATYYLTDQTALKDTENWMMFLNQETAVFPGPEKIASRLNQSVVFMDIQKIKRGYYEVEFTKLVDNASETKEYEITKKHLKFLEDIIIKRPEHWLWTHKRWKHKRPQNINLK